MALPPSIQFPPESRPAETAPESNGPLIHVQQFRIEGATLFPAATLAALVADLQGREIPLSQAREAAARITRHYRDAGYFVARAYLPPQSSTEGVLILQVVEGRYGEVKPGASSLDPDLVGATLARQGVAAGQPIRRADLERGLLLLEDLGQSATRASLRPGVSVGTGDLLVDAAGLPRWSGDLGLDTFGAESSGQTRLNDGIQYSGGRGDLARLRLTHASGLDYHAASYQRPVGNSGLKLGLNHSVMRYDLGGAFAALGAQGDSRISGLNAAYPLFLGQGAKLHATASLEHKALKDDTNAGNSADKRIDLVTLGLNGVHAVPGRLYQGRASLTAGDLDLGRNPAQQAADAAAGRTQGQYAVLRADGRGQFDLDAGRSLVIRAEGQYPDGNLDSSEKLALGGPHAVRAYATGESAADSGLIAHLEWATPLALELPGRTRFTAFLDAGYARLYQNLYPGALAAGQRNSYGLYGVGGELAWSNAGGLSLNLTLAARLGSPPAQVTERDTLRAWFSLQQMF